MSVNHGALQLAGLLRPPLNHERSRMCADLYLATLDGNIDRVNRLLGLTTEITHTASQGTEILLEESPESNRSYEQNWEVRIHADGLCSLREVTAVKNTVLHIAAEQGHFELSERLLREDNTLLTSQNSRQETPLHLAARAGKTRTISHIVSLAKGFGIAAEEVLSQRSTDGDTVLHEAARHGHEDTVQLLMAEAPALSAVVNNASMSPLYLAVFRKSVGAVRELLRDNSHPSAVGPNQQNALHAAVLRSGEITSLLLNWKSELASERDASGSTPLHYAASNDDVTLVQKILEKAPSAVYIRDEEGSSPLHAAARMGFATIIESMIDRCPDSFELRDNQGRNFLHIVSQNGGKFKLSRRDLRKLVNERDNEGNTPLHFASMKGSSEVLEHFLKESKADATVMNNEGKTALDCAISLSSFSVMARTTTTLSAYGATFSPQRQDKLKSWKGGSEKWIDKTSENLIIVSVLIATIAFSAAFNVPGSYNDEGLANLREKKQYNILVVLDTIAMSASVSATMLLVVAKGVGKSSSWPIFSYSLIFLWISLFTMELAFVTAVSLALGRGKALTESVVFLISYLFFFWTVMGIREVCFPAKFKIINKFLSSTKEQTQTARQIDIQFPMLTSFVRNTNLFIYLNLIFYFITLVVPWTAPLWDYN